MEGRFRRELEELTRVFEMSEEFFSTNAIETPDRETIDLVIEEIFTNIVRHGSKAAEEIVVKLEKSGGEVAISLVDFDAIPFDPTKQPAPEIDAPIDEREPGGLGIHLVRRFSNGVEYEHHDRTSKVTVHRKLS